jgi:hypothetical protein
VYIISPCSFFDPAISAAIEFDAAEADPELVVSDDVVDPELLHATSATALTDATAIASALRRREDELDIRFMAPLL